MDTESQSQQQQTTNQQDNRNVLGQGSVQANGGSSVVINTLDADVANHAINTTATVASDSIKGANDALRAALNFSSGAGNRAFDFALKSQTAALDSLHEEANLVKDSYADAKGRGALTDKILIGAIAMAGLVAIAALRK